MNYPLYNNTLCLRIWDHSTKTDEYEMKPEVRRELLSIATDFVKTNIEDNGLPLIATDIVLIGSLTNYNWTPYSDFDLHIIVDLTDLDVKLTDAQLLVDGLKGMWNKSHEITIKGHPVELYVQDVSAKPHSLSSYSVKTGKWIKKPVKDKPKFDKDYIKTKHERAKTRLDDLFSEPTEKKLETELERVYAMRQAGLDKKGEFSEENIVFKILRAQGYLDKLKDLIVKVYDEDHSLDEAR